MKLNVETTKKKSSKALSKVYKFLDDNNIVVNNVTSKEVNPNMNETNDYTKDYYILVSMDVVNADISQSQISKINDIIDSVGGSYVYSSTAPQDLDEAIPAQLNDADLVAVPLVGRAIRHVRYPHPAENINVRWDVAVDGN